jgi:hypothetical protein
MSQTGWGKPKYGGEQFQKTGKPGKGPGNNFIRILPPMFSLAEAGKWAVYRTTHWGYSGAHPSDPTKTVVRPFLCIEESNGRTKMVTQVCPECDNYREKLAARDAKAAELKAAGMDDETIKSTLKSRNDWLQAHGPERKWYLNVKYKDGTFGDYKINHKIHKKGIDAKIAELEAKYKIDALDPEQGVWFNIKRIGNGFDPPDVIEIGTKSVTIEGGQVAEVIEKAPLSQEDWDKASRTCRDLSTLGGTVLNFDQIKQLVKCSGAPEEVDAIFGGKLGGSSPSKAAPAQQTAPVHQEDDDEPVNEAPAALAKTLASLTNTDPGAVAVDPAAAAAQARYEAIMARMKAEEEEKKAKARAEAEAVAKAEAALKAAQPKPADSILAVNIQSDTEFLAAFEAQRKAAAAAAAGASK